MTLVGDIQKIKTFLAFAETQLSYIRSGQNSSLTLSSIFERLPNSVALTIPLLSDTLDMEDILELLVDFFKQKLSYLNALGTALIYPSVLFIAILGVSLIYIMFVIPNLSSLLPEHSPTSSLLSSLFTLHIVLKSNGDFILLILICSIFLLTQLVQTSSTLRSLIFTTHRSDLYFLIGLMLKQGLSLNTVFNSLNPTPTTGHATHITHIKQHLFNTGSLYKALQATFPLTELEHHYLSKSDYTNSFDKDLLTLSRLLAENHTQKQIKTAKKLHYYALILLSGIISLMIYLTFIPITKSIELSF